MITARARGLQAIDGPYSAIPDIEGFRTVAERSARLGCDGKWALHPTQIEILNEVYRPSQAQYDRAEALLAAYRLATTEGERRGAVMWEGEMIDEASRKMAEQVAARGRAAGMSSGGLEAGAAPRRAWRAQTHVIHAAAATDTWASTTPQGSWLCHWYSPMNACSGSRTISASARPRQRSGRHGPNCRTSSSTRRRR